MPWSLRQGLRLCSPPSLSLRRARAMGRGTTERREDLPDSCELNQSSFDAGRDRDYGWDARDRSPGLGYSAPSAIVAVSRYSFETNRTLAESLGASGAGTRADPPPRRQFPMGRDQ